MQKLWPPLNAPEYGVYMAQIKPDVDAIYTGFAGSNPLRFLKAFAEFGMKGKIAVLGNTTMTDEGILKVMGEEAVGVYSAGWYAAGLDTPDNKKFVAGINANTSTIPASTPPAPTPRCSSSRRRSRPPAARPTMRRPSSRRCTTCA